MALQFKKDRTASWGVRGVFSSNLTDGVVVSGRVSVNDVSEPVRNVYGAIVKRIIYDYAVSCEIMALVGVSTQPPKIGESATVNFTNGQTVSGFVTKSAVVETNQSFRKIAIVVESHYHCATPVKEASVTQISGDASWDSPTFDFRA